MRDDAREEYIGSGRPNNRQVTLERHIHLYMGRARNYLNWLDGKSAVFWAEKAVALSIEHYNLSEPHDPIRLAETKKLKRTSCNIGPFRMHAGLDNATLYPQSWSNRRLFLSVVFFSYASLPVPFTLSNPIGSIFNRVNSFTICFSPKSSKKTGRMRRPRCTTMRQVRLGRTTSTWPHLPRICPR